MVIVDHKNCTGCGCCAEICPKQCITIAYDEDGFLMPQIDGSACVQCGRCQKACPALHPVERTPILSVFKAYSKRIESERNQKSTSGAVFAALAESVLARGGVVAGAAFCEDFRNVRHILCTCDEELDQCRGSKYIQSRTDGIYRGVKSMLEAGKPVLFSGTPCQIAAVRSYLGAKKYDQFYTVDFICHGVASTTYYQQFLDTVCGTSAIRSVAFRNKTDTYIRSHLTIRTQDGMVKDEYFNDEPYFGKAFANNLISRMSCAGCPYASASRTADITLADNFRWADEYEKQYGSSLVCINTKKGELLFDTAGEELVFAALDAETVIRNMQHLNSPPIPHKNRKRLFQALRSSGLSDARAYITDYQMKKTDVIRTLVRRHNPFK